MYKSTKEVLKDFRSNQEDKLQHHLTSQGFFFSNVIKYSLSSLNSVCSEVQSHLPKNIYNFTIRYINNSLPTRKNMASWGLSQSPDCSFCLNPESLLHAVAGCQQYLDRFTWRHDSILNFIAKSLQPVINVHSSLYADVNGFLNPSIVGGGGGGGGGTGGSQSPASRTPFSRLPYLFVPLSPDSRPLLCFSRYHVNHAV